MNPHVAKMAAAPRNFDFNLFTPDCGDQPLACANALRVKGQPPYVNTGLRGVLLPAAKILSFPANLHPMAAKLAAAFPRVFLLTNLTVGLTT